MSPREQDPYGTIETGREPIPVPQHSPFVVSTPPDPRTRPSPTVERAVYATVRKDLARGERQDKGA